MVTNFSPITPAAYISRVEKNWSSIEARTKWYKFCRFHNTEKTDQTGYESKQQTISGSNAVRIVYAKITILEALKSHVISLISPLVILYIKSENILHHLKS